MFARVLERNWVPGRGLTVEGNGLRLRQPRAGGGGGFFGSRVGFSRIGLDWVGLGVRQGRGIGFQDRDEGFAVFAQGAGLIIPGNTFQVIHDVLRHGGVGAAMAGTTLGQAVFLVVGPGDLEFQALVGQLQLVGPMVVVPLAAQLGVELAQAVPALERVGFGGDEDFGQLEQFQLQSGH